MDNVWESYFEDNAIATEGLKDRIKAAGNAILDFIKKIMDAVKSFMVGMKMNKKIYLNDGMLTAVKELDKLHAKVINIVKREDYDGEYTKGLEKIDQEIIDARTAFKTAATGGMEATKREEARPFVTKIKALYDQLGYQRKIVTKMIAQGEEIDDGRLRAAKKKVSLINKSIAAYSMVLKSGAKKISSSKATKNAKAYDKVFGNESLTFDIDDFAALESYSGGCGFEDDDIDFDEDYE